MSVNPNVNEFVNDNEFYHSNNVNHNFDDQVWLNHNVNHNANHNEFDNDDVNDMQPQWKYQRW